MLHFITVNVDRSDIKLLLLASHCILWMYAIQTRLAMFAGSDVLSSCSLPSRPVQSPSCLIYGIIYIAIKFYNYATITSLMHLSTGGSLKKGGGCQSCRGGPPITHKSKQFFFWGSSRWELVHLHLQYENKYANYCCHLQLLYLLISHFISRHISSPMH